MIHSNDTLFTEVRENMRGGSGSVSITHLWKQEEMSSPFCRMAAVITLPPGSSIGFHTHENEEEIFYVISGTAALDDNGTLKTLNTGDTSLTGNGAGHSLANAGSCDLVVMAVINKFQEKA